MSTLSFDPSAFIAQLAHTPLNAWSELLADSVLTRGHALKHGHLPRWENAVATLPNVTDAMLIVDDGIVRIKTQLGKHQQNKLHEALSALMPWRKGPFAIGPIYLDTEWRSDWKWDRLAPHLQTLKNRVVLDVGCGNGYHLWRMREAGAHQVLGIDPNLLYLMQFNVLQHYAKDPAVQFLPLPLEALPLPMKAFDTVCSMGVLYHRRDPAQHLQQLAQALKPGGELVLETLIIPDSTDASLKLSGRYANMRNIYELPSVSRLETWVRFAGFSDIRTVSIDRTSRREQRSTQWMPSHSLDQALDPKNLDRTVEGHPRPLRAIVIAASP